ncbi:lytic transglycosylase domain-containing protein [Streptomyces wuyuanensis]|uniref:Membrane-bound lytic murein transglycosylase B n=1 Tax=Streptomyces wuyuanensis TaxID=1196353 RepID=A0A1G9N7M7_9ACTN|nr:lytic transglycosylase domain-containing protein [Streptomyces wuyuanensis]SDL82414.1 Membrane-bound lytic murein transglycosylase B [Streptomyces wuyuanensis]
MTGRTRRGVRATAIATAAMAALAGSQAPVPVAGASPPAKRPAPPGPDVLGDGAYRTELPPLRRSPAGSGPKGAEGAGTPVAGALPETVFGAYRKAEESLAVGRPGCRLRWQLLAAIGQVESGQAHGGRVREDGTTLTPILGPRLDGHGFALIRDTDGGRYDGDTVFDRAVGPMQFIPSTWASWGADGNGDGRSDPGNVFDAALAAGRYLCAGGRDLSEETDLDRAILGYNHSTAYLRTVRAWFAYFLEGHRVVPDRGGAPGPRSEPEPADTPRPPASSAGAPRPGGGRDQGTPAPPSSPPEPSASPSPSPGAPAPGPTPLPVPADLTELPGSGVLPGRPDPG